MELLKKQIFVRKVLNYENTFQAVEGEKLLVGLLVMSEENNQTHKFDNLLEWAEADKFSKKEEFSFQPLSYAKNFLKHYLTLLEKSPSEAESLRHYIWSKVRGYYHG